MDEFYRIRGRKSDRLLGRKALLDGQTFQIDQPIFGQIVKEWVIPIRYGVRDRTGKLRYILNTPIALSTQQNFWHSLYLPEKAQMGLLRDDGYLLSLYPLPKTADIDKIFGKIRTDALAVLLRQQRFSQHGLVEGYNSVAHADYNFAYYRLPNHPITFFVATPVSDIRAKWWTHNQPFYWLTLIFSASGFIIYYCMLRRSSRWKSEREQHEENFRSIYESSHDAIILLTPQGFLDCNQRTLKIFGMIDKSEFLSCPPAHLSLPLQPDGQDSAAAANEHIVAAFEQGSNRFEWVCRRKNGEDFPAEIILSAFSFGGKRVLQATVRDITDRKTAQDQVEFLAYHDVLTGLPNRLLAKDHFEL